MQKSPEQKKEAEEMVRAVGRTLKAYSDLEGEVMEIILSLHTVTCTLAYMRDQAVKQRIILEEAVGGPFPDAPDGPIINPFGTDTLSFVEVMGEFIDKLNATGMPDLLDSEVQKDAVAKIIGVHDPVKQALLNMPDPGVEN